MKYYPTAIFYYAFCYKILYQLEWKVQFYILEFPCFPI